MSEFTVNYHPNWKIDENLDEKFVKFPINDSSNELATAIFKVNDQTAYVTSDYLCKLIVDDIESIGTIENIASQEISKQSMLGFGFVVTWNSNNIETKQLFRYLIDGDKSYGFVFSTLSQNYDEYEPIVDELLHSFKINEDPNYNWYVNPTNDYKILYPNDWIEGEDSTEIDLISFTTNSGSSLTILKIPNEKNQNLDEIIKEPHIVLQNVMPMTELIETREMQFWQICPQRACYSNGICLLLKCIHSLSLL